MLLRRTFLLTPLALVSSAAGAVSVWKTTAVGMSTMEDFAFCVGVGAARMRVEVWLDPDRVSRADVQGLRRFLSTNHDRFAMRFNVGAKRK